MSSRRIALSLASVSAVLLGCSAPPAVMPAPTMGPTTDPLAVPIPAEERRARELLRSAEDLVLERSPQRLEAGLAMIDEALRLRPGWGRAYEERAFLKWKLDRAAEAIDDLTLALANGLDDPAAAYRRRGELRRDLGDLDGGIADLTSSIAVTLLPQRAGPFTAVYLADAYLERGIAWQGKRDLAKAITDISAAVGLRPGHVYSLVRRGVLWSQLDRRDFAALDLDRALALEPSNMSALYARGEVFLLEGDPSAAMEHFKAALASSGGHPADAEWRKNVDDALERAKRELEAGAW